MVNELAKLYNTLMLIETKGENTKHMAMCMQYLEGLIAREQDKEQTPVEEPAESTKE